MDADEEILQDTSGEAEYPALSEAEWRADLMAYMGSPEGDERQPDEFTVMEVVNLYPRMSESGITKRLAALVRRGVYTRRRAIVDGHSVWLYRRAT